MKIALIELISDKNSKMEVLDHKNFTKGKKSGKHALTGSFLLEWVKNLTFVQ